MVSVWILLGWKPLDSLLIYWTKNHEAASTPQNLHVRIITKAGDITSYSKKHVLPSSCTCPVYTRYIPGIHMSYSLICFFAGLSKFSSAPGGFRPGLSTDPLFFFLRQKTQRPEAGACQRSTASCWSHKHGCLLVRNGRVVSRLSSRKHGNSGTCPRRSSTLPTYRVETGCTLVRFYTAS